MIKDMYDKKKGRLTYIIENVPSAAALTAITEALGPPIKVEATNLVSVAKRTTALWTNGASIEELLRDYQDHHHHPHQGLTIQQLLEGSPQFNNWNVIWSEQRKFQKVMARGGSYQYSYQSDGTPGKGMLYYTEDDDVTTIKKPSPAIREVAMGFGINAIVARGAMDQLRNMILGGSLDANILR